MQESRPRSRSALSTTPSVLQVRARELVKKFSPFGKFTSGRERGDSARRDTDRAAAKPSRSSSSSFPYSYRASRSLDIIRKPFGASIPGLGHRESSENSYSASPSDDSAQATPERRSMQGPFIPPNSLANSMSTPQDGPMPPYTSFEHEALKMQRNGDDSELPTPERRSLQTMFRRPDSPTQSRVSWMPDVIVSMPPLPPDSREQDKLQTSNSSSSQSSRPQFLKLSGSITGQGLFNEPGSMDSPLATNNEIFSNLMLVSTQSQEPTQHKGPPAVSPVAPAQSEGPIHNKEPFIVPPARRSSLAAIIQATAPPGRANLLRLSTLPPLSALPFDPSDPHTSARLSPSLITRPAPLPLRNLPTLNLPPPSTTPARPKPSAAVRLRSMPALPMRASGTNAEEDEDAMGESDEEGEDGEEEDEGDEENGGATANGSEDEDADTAGDDTSSGAHSHSLHRPALSAFGGLSSSFRLRPSTSTPASTSSSSLGTRRDRDAPQSTSATSAQPPADFDYFTSKSQARSPHTSQSSIRTPRPGDFKSSPVPPVPRLSIPLVSGGGGGIGSAILAPKVRMPSGDDSRPQLYHQASKSMIDLSQKSPAITADHLLTVSAKKKGKAPALAVLAGDNGEVESSGAVQLPSALATKKSNVSQDVVDTNASIVTNSTASNITAGPSGTIKRRRSMPTFNASSEPPPYPSFFFLQHPNTDNGNGQGPHPHAGSGIEIVPRDEEGMERLPEYSSDISLSAIMPRKMEFTAPGIQARDRKWRRVHCVLQGTVFKVFKCPPSSGASGVLGDWWEKKVGVGNVTVVSGTLGETGKPSVVVEATTPGAGKDVVVDNVVEEEQRRESGDVVPEREVQGVQQPQPHHHQKSKFSNLLHPSRAVAGFSSSSGTNSASSSSFRSRSSFDISRSPSPAAPSTLRSSISLSRPASRLSGTSSSAHTSTSSSTSPSSSSSHERSANSNNSAYRRSHLRSQSAAASTSSRSSTPAPLPNQRELLAEFTLQHAESGLASDYLKRKNVVRVRMEGQQFLLQAQDVAAVVEWIEGFQAAANVALDLDVRPMPRGPMIPRRRRRRRVPATDQPQARSDSPDTRPEQQS